MTASQKNVLTRHGQPDYIRDRYRSRSNEIVVEWAWWDRQVIAQFVQRELVFEGPLTDRDKTLIRFGLPARAYSQSYEDGVMRDIWQYQGIFDTQGAVFTFSNEELVSTHRF